MAGIIIKSHDELLSYISKKENVYLLLFKEGSNLSKCAYDNIIKAVKSSEDNNYLLLFANVNETRDIHPNYGIKSVPMLLHFKGGEYKKSIAGCNNAEYYGNLFNNVSATLSKQGEKKKNLKVVVYTTPSCPWCNKLKQYLRENNIPFRDIDVSKDMNAAKEMMKNTGQQGVPQAQINGQWVIGFDKPKIDKLLGITVK